MTDFQFRAPGKILLVGEYLVLKGSPALAFPVKWAQKMEVTTNALPFLFWKSLDLEGREWFTAEFDENLEVIATHRPEVAQTLKLLLEQAGKLNPAWKSQLMGHQVTMQCEFDRNYGLGTSATLVACIAAWSQTNGHQIQWPVFGGSGYDVAVSYSGNSLCYQLINGEPQHHPIQFHPENTQHWRIYFTGHKVNSRSSQQMLSDRWGALTSIQPALDQWVQKIEEWLPLPGQTNAIHQNLMQWSLMLAETTGLTLPEPAANLANNGVCKWLGAWGGDMILCDEKTALKNASYFSGLNFQPFNQLVL